MRRLAVRAELAYELTAPTSFLFAIAAQADDQEVVEQHLSVEPGTDVERLAYGRGGHEVVRLRAEGTDLRVVYEAKVDVAGPAPDAERAPEHDVPDLPGEVLPFLDPSRYCPSVEVAGLAARRFAGLRRGHSRVQAICDWVGLQLDYVPGSSDATTTAVEALARQAGVCRDFAHVAIALLRASGVPARYVSGYGLGVDPPDFHGFVEAYLGGAWQMFDPTGMTTADGVVRIASGRDAADVAFATIHGPATLTVQDVAISELD